MQRNGFSLVELSIVLVILGLLVGGIMTGQNLIRAAELRKIPADFDKYRTAVYIFQDKYFELPGDFTKAGQFWGYASGGATGPCVDSLNDLGTGTQTCDGDGNGNIADAEMFRAWQHLANAGLIEGAYTGVTNAGHLPGENCPLSKIGNAGYELRNHQTAYVGNSYYFDGEYGNQLMFGTLAGGGHLTFPVITPAEAWGIDTKLDDGKPALGRLRVYHEQFRPDCTNTSDPAAGDAAEYDLGVDDTTCALIFITGL